MTRILAAVLASIAALALAAPAHASRASDALKRELGPGVKVAAHGETGQVRFVGAAARPIETGAASARDAARVFVARHGDAFGGGDLAITSSHDSSVRFQQRVDGIPVVGGELVVNVDRDGDVVSASGELLPGSVDRTPRVTAAAARQEAIAAVAKERQVSAVRLTTTTPRLWIYDARLLGGPGPRRPTLVWRLDVKGDSGLAIDDLVLIDATLGHTAARIPQIEEALDRQICDGNGTALLVPCTAVAAARSEGEAATGIAEVDFAYEYAGDTYDFFLDNFGRDSLDDDGMTLFNTVRHCPSPAQCPFDNAFWNGSQMVYGDGWAAGDDLVGHELTHGVTDFSAHLFYYYQSGAINESMSDVFGELVDLANGTGTDTADARWQVFEDVVGGPYRDMQDPGSVLQGDPPLPSPDRMTSADYFAAEADQGGVHFNSGVNNKAAYLMTDGDTFNGRTVSGIGTEKVGRIYYDVLTTMLTSGSDYADLASALPAACDNLVGTLGITAANCTEVRDAVAAVEMSTDSTEAPAPHAPAATCPAGEVRTDLFEDDMEASPNWQTGGTAPWQFTDAYAHSGTTSLFGPDTAARGENILIMRDSVALPDDATSFLRFDHSYGFEDNASDVGFDGGVLEISVNDGAFADIGSLLTEVGYTGAITNSSDNPLAGRPAFIGESNGYRASRARLTPRAGDDVRFRFRIATDTGVSGAGWFVDDVHIYSCAEPPAPPDGDGDGVSDASDACPTVAAATPNGCPAGPGPTSPTGPGGPGGPTAPDPTGPAVSLASATVRSCKLAGRGRKARLRCTLRGFGAVTRASVTVKKGRRTVARKTVRPSAAGVLSFKPSRRLRRGTYKVTLVLRDASGDRRSITKKLRVR